MGVTVAEALELAEDKPFWRTIATAGRFSWLLHIWRRWWWYCTVILDLMLLVGDEMYSLLVPIDTYLRNILRRWTNLEYSSLSVG